MRVHPLGSPRQPLRVAALAATAILLASCGATSKSSSATTKEASASSAEQTTTPGTSTPSSSVPATPSPLSFSKRTFWFGNSSTLFEIDLKKATVISDGSSNELHVTGTATNLEKADASFDLSGFLEAGGQRYDVSGAGTAAIPGGGAKGNIEFTSALSSASFPLKDAVLTFGNQASNQSIVPFDEAKPVTSFKPITGVAVGQVSDNGAGTSWKVTQTVLHQDYTDGNKDKYQLELYYDFNWQHASPGGHGGYARVALTAPDGTSQTTDEIKGYNSNPGETPMSLSYVFTIAAPYAGPYSLTFTSDTSLYPTDTGHPGTIKFSMPAHG